MNCWQNISLRVNLDKKQLSFVLIITEYLQYTQTEANDQTEWIKTGIEYKKQTDIQ